MNMANDDNRTVTWLGVSVFFLSLLFIWQGLDFTDMGFWLVGYQQFYVHPDTFWSVCWLTSFFGHWLGLALGGGVVAYKLGYVAVITMLAIIAYLLLSTQLGRSRFLAAVVLMTVFFVGGYNTNWVSYNELTGLFYLAGAALLFWGLTDNVKIYIVFAGIVLGANVFIRLPNILGLLLLSSIWLYAWAYRWSFREVLICSSMFLVGYIFGVALVLGLIVMHGHREIYFQGVKVIFADAQSVSNVHSGSGMFNRLISDYVRAFSEALFLLIIGGAGASWASKLKILPAAIFVVCTALLFWYLVFFRAHMQWVIPGICYIVILSIVIFEIRRNTNLALLAFISGMILIITPLGSANGIVNSLHGMWLALPLTLIYIWKSDSCAFSLQFLRLDSVRFWRNGQFTMESKGFRILVIIILLAILIQTLNSAWRHTYHDSENRFMMSNSIVHPLLVGTYTTAERAKVVTELLDAMSIFSNPGDEVLAYNGIPTLYFLTETHPWLGISWPDFESVEKLTALIAQQEKISNKLPLIVRATGSTYTDSWPVSAKPLASFWHQDEPRRVFEEFEKRHEYVVAWSNDFFEILTTTQKK